MDPLMNRYIVTVGHSKQSDRLVIVNAASPESATTLAEREMAERNGGIRSAYTAKKVHRFPLEGIVNRHAELRGNVAGDVTVDDDQRAVIEYYNLTVRRDDDCFVIVDPLQANEEASPDLSALLMKVIEAHDALFRPKVEVAGEPGEPGQEPGAAPSGRGALMPAKRARRAGGGWDEYPSTAKIHIKVKECPRKPGSGGAKHWELYKEGMTVGELRTAGGDASRLKTDLNRGSLELIAV